MVIILYNIMLIRTVSLVMSSCLHLCHDACSEWIQCHNFAVALQTVDKETQTINHKTISYFIIHIKTRTPACLNVVIQISNSMQPRSTLNTYHQLTSKSKSDVQVQLYANIVYVTQIVYRNICLYGEYLILSDNVEINK
jgi:hypothetical protein